MKTVPDIIPSDVSTHKLIHPNSFSPSGVPAIGGKGERGNGEKARTETVMDGLVSAIPRDQ